MSDYALHLRTQPSQVQGIIFIIKFHTLIINMNN